MINFTDLPDKKRYVFVALWTKTHKYRGRVPLMKTEELPKYVYYLELKLQLLKYIGDTSALRTEIERTKWSITENNYICGLYEAVKDFDSRAVKDMAKWISKAEADYDYCYSDYNELKESSNE